MPASRVATALTVLAGGTFLASTALLVSRWVPYDALPVSSDTWAMATAFTDLSAAGDLVALGAAAGAVALRRGRPQVVVAAACAAAVVAQALLLGPRWVAAPPPSAPATSVTVLSLNSELGLADPDSVIAAAAAADVVVLTEVTDPQVRALTDAGFARRFPHRTDGSLPGRGADGTAVFSRFPLTGAERLSPALAHQSWVCAVDVPGLPSPLTVVAVHPDRPHLGGGRWLGEQEDLRAALPTSGPRLLAGDFNAVASHPTQRAIVADGWRSTVDEAGAGWVPTYPADSAHLPPLIDIDHVYVAGALRTTSARSVRVAGTDHLGLLVTVAVPDRS